MHLNAYHIVPQTFARLAFNAAGADPSCGRWNSDQRLLFYAAQSRSLAALECLVHMDRDKIAQPHVIVPVSFPEHLVTRLRDSELPPNWFSPDPSPELRQIGDEWAVSEKSAVLCVPSAVVRAECNYLINPHHPDYGQIQVGRSEDFSFDPRLAT